ncbi:arginine deiminase [Inquilinus sp. OTU3971]|uniref:arginine deiminase n=1 Tax=Inquilinus sp. OTU3971 TaxID=3043855 RepID=UPI00406CD512
MITLGVHSEVGRLREVLVHRPDLSLRRLTPDNCHAPLFDDVLWVKKARQEHDVFVDALRERGVTVRDLGDLLAETMALPEVRRWLLDRRVDPAVVGCDPVDELRGWLDELPAADLATRLVGGIARAELPFAPAGLSARALAPEDFVLPPLPNQLFTRDSSCWIYGGVTVNSMYWPARQPEAANVEAIYRFHSRFRDAGFAILSEGGGASLEGGDVMPIGGGVILIGMGERTTPQAVSALARRLFATGTSERVIATLMPRDRSFMHLDMVFTFCDRDLVTIYPLVVDRLRSKRTSPRTIGVPVKSGLRQRPHRPCSLRRSVGSLLRLSPCGQQATIIPPIDVIGLRRPRTQGTTSRRDAASGPIFRPECTGTPAAGPAGHPKAAG